MSAPIDRVETHTTTWRGCLSRDELEAILVTALSDKLGAPRYGLTLQIDFGPERDHAFVLVHDHDWYLKPDPDLDGPEPA